VTITIPERPYRQMELLVGQVKAKLPKIHLRDHSASFPRRGYLETRDLAICIMQHCGAGNMDSV
jgi:hypothetical protein